MRLTDALSADRIVLDLQAQTKDEAIAELIHIAATGGDVDETPAQLQKLVLEREALTSTAVDKGVAIPHARSGRIKGIVVSLGIHRQGLDFLSEHLPEVRQPFKVAPEWMVLIDLGLGAREDPQQILSDLFECACDQGLVQDGMIAQSEAQRADFWAVRERMPEANRLVGAVSNHDISLPLSALPAFIEAANQTIARIGPFRVNCFGHLGDGNLHYNVFPDSGKTRQDYEDLRPRIKTDLHDLVHEMHGSVSAEHGIGRLKIEDLERYGDPAKLAAMRAIKTALDPHGIMNPGAVLRLKTL